MYSTQNEEKSVAAERFIRTLKNEIYKYMTSVVKNVCINKLDDIANKCNSKYKRICSLRKFFFLVPKLS